VRLAWRGVPLVNVRAPVRYLRPEEGGRAHFDYLRDTRSSLDAHAPRARVRGAAFRCSPSGRLRARAARPAGRARGPACGQPGPQPGRGDIVLITAISTSMVNTSCEMTPRSSPR